MEKFEDNYKIKGYMKIESFDKDDNLIDSYEDNNLVMDLARNSMQYLAGNVTSKFEPINSLRLGTRGVHGVEYGNPILPSNDGYHPEMTHLFQEADNSTDGGYVFVCKFDVQGEEEEIFDSVSEELLKYGVPMDGYISSGQTMKRTVQDRTITFEVTMPRESQNSFGGGGEPQWLPFSEQQLYCGDRIFSMKTFPQKFKDSDQKIVLTWSIIF